MGKNTRNAGPSAPPEAAGAPVRNRFPAFFAGFVLAFILAFVAAWYLFSTPPPPPPPPAPAERILGAADLAEFFRAVEAGDFPAMSRLGGELFEEGAIIRDGGETLSPYETNTFSDYRVYAFLSRTQQDRTYRVLLTIDGKDRVVSFLAEEMALSR